MRSLTSPSPFGRRGSERDRSYLRPAVIAGLGTTLALSDGRGENLTGLGWSGVAVAALGFVMMIVATVMIWRPFHGTFILDAGKIVGDYVEGDPPAELSEIHRDLALHLGKHAGQPDGD